jgi:hypothetical protein
MAVSGYCLKCKSPRDIKDAQAITMKNGKPATTGTCPVCGTKIFKIGKATSPRAAKGRRSQLGAAASPGPGSAGERLPDPLDVELSRIDDQFVARLDHIVRRGHHGFAGADDAHHQVARGQPDLAELAADQP